MEPEGSLPHSKHPPPLPNLSQNIPVITSTSQFLKMHFNITLLFTPCSSKWSLSLTSPHQNSACTSPIPHILPYSPTPPTNRHKSYGIRSNAKKKKSDYAEIFTPCVYFLTHFSSECAPNYACVKTGNLYVTNRVNGCCEGKFAGERSWDVEVTLNRWNLNIHFAKKLSTFVLKRQNGKKSVTTFGTSKGICRLSPCYSTFSRRA